MKFTVRLLSAVLALALASLLAASAQGQPDVETLLVRVGERIAEFYTRAQNVICIETSTVQSIDSSYSPAGFVRTVESELRVEADGGQAPGEASLVRRIRKVNGRVPRENDKKNRNGCTDPNPLSTEPLAFLLPANRSEYQFRLAGIGKDRNRDVLMVDFASADRASRLELVEDAAGHDDCFDWSGDIALRGRVWIDAATYDVVRVERGLRGPIDVRVPALIQRRYHLANWISLMRDDVTIRYKTVVFSEPDESLLLPESIDTLTMIRGGLESTRRNQKFSDYTRFVTGARILE